MGRTQGVFRHGADSRIPAALHGFQPCGSRPTAVKQTRYEWVYLYAAVEPKSGDSVALQASGGRT